MLKLPDGSKVEVFGADSDVNRAPDGNLYELTQDPGVSWPH